MCHLTNLQNSFSAYVAVSLKSPDQLLRILISAKVACKVKATETQAVEMQSGLLLFVIPIVGPAVMDNLGWFSRRSHRSLSSQRQSLEAITL